MFGFFYLLWAMISNAGAVIKESIHNVNAEVDPRTNTFINYQGNHVDYDTGELRFWSVDENGDEVLRDKKFRIIRNLSEEDRIKEYKSAKECKVSCIAIDTKEKRDLQFYNGVCNVKCKANIYKDLRTGAEYVATTLCIDQSKHIQKEFYAMASNPNILVCISDRQKNIEQKFREMHLYNWITYQEDEQEFIKSNNNKEMSIFSDRKLVFNLK